MGDPVRECGTEYVRDPSKIISGIFVRPEDLEVYEEVGVSRFKISGRNRSTDWLVHAARAYSARSYPGDLTEILSLVQLKGPRAALRRIGAGRQNPAAETLGAAFGPLENISIDNTAFPQGFLRHIAAVDCEHTTCTACGYCRGVAEKVLRISGQRPSEYRVQEGLPMTIRLLPELGYVAAPEKSPDLRSPARA